MSNDPDDCDACTRCGENMTRMEWASGHACDDCKAEDAWYQELAEEAAS